MRSQRRSTPARTTTVSLKPVLGGRGDSPSLVASLTRSNADQCFAVTASATTQGPRVQVPSRWSWCGSYCAVPEMFRMGTGTPMLRASMVTPKVATSAPR